MDGRLMADLGRIWQVPGRLSWVERELSEAAQFADEDLGSAELASALDGWVAGWSQQRAALSAQLATVARLAALAASSYEKTDEQLGAVLEESMNLP